MPDVRELLEREVAHLAPPEAWEPVQRRALQRHRRRRIGAALVAVAVAAVGTVGVWMAAGGLRHGSDGPKPAGGSWDGGRIANQCDATVLASNASNPNLCTMRRDGSDRRVLRASPTPMWDPAWSPDGSRIAFRGYWEAGCEGCSDLYLMDADGSNLRRITHDATPSHPAWSPDGRWIVFDTGGNGSLMKVRPDGTGLTKLSAGASDGTEDVWPAWSPDGSRIAFGRFRPTEPVGLWMMRADGTESHRVVDAADVQGSIAQPAWSPDGRILAFVVGNRDDSTIWAWDAAPALDGDPKNGPWPLTAGADRDWNPQWIDGGARVAFLHGTPAERSNLEAVRVDGSGIPPGSRGVPNQRVGVPEGSQSRKTLIADFPGDQFAFQPPPGGAAGACLDPGPAGFVTCSDALQRAGIEDSGPQGASIDVRLVRGVIHSDGSVDPADDRMVWAVTYRDVAATKDGPTPTPTRIDWEVDVDAVSGVFVSEGTARSAA